MTKWRHFLLTVAQFRATVYISVGVNTMLTKMFFDGFEQLNNLVCQITMSCNCKLADHHFYYYLLFCFIILLLSVFYCCLDDEIKDVCNTPRPNYTNRH